jgi:methyl-accepting chemotaxis protein
MTLGIRGKILGGYLAMVALLLIVGGTGTYYVMTINNADTFLYEKATVSLAYVAQIDTGIHTARTQLRKAMMARTLADRKTALDAFEAAVGVAAKGEAAYPSTYINDQDKKNFEDYLDARKQWYDAAQKVIANLNRVGIPEVPAKVTLPPETYLIPVSDTADYTQTSNRLVQVLATLTDLNTQTAKQISDGNNTLVGQSLLILVIIAVASVVVALAFGFLLTRSIMRTFKVVDDSAEYVTMGTSQISTSSEELAQGSSEQAASVEEVSASVEELTATIRQNADNASQTEKIATKSAVDAKEGGAAVKQTVEAMKNISGKVVVIQEIARQTNLLSLNAAIEAARAGEHGRGFAVVATEVQKLAERSQTAAKEIEELSKSSVGIAEQAGKMLDKLVPDIQRTADLVTEINAASEEQAGGVQQINQAVQQLNTVVQENASSSEELASTAEELSSQSQLMRDAILFLRTGRRQGGAAPAEPKGPARPTSRATPHAQAQTPPHAQPTRAPSQGAQPFHPTKDAKPPLSPPAGKAGTGVTIHLGKGDKEDDDYERY